MAEQEIDWTKAAEVFSTITADMMHHERTELGGHAFYAEALRRMWERVGHQWVTREYCDRVLKMNRDQDRENGERAEATLRHWSDQYPRELIRMRAILAAALRAQCNEVTVPSRLRREGVNLAAGWMDGGGLPALTRHDDLVTKVRKAWDAELTGPAETAVDTAQARIAVNTVLAALTGGPVEGQPPVGPLDALGQLRAYAEELCIPGHPEVKRELLRLTQAATENGDDEGR